MPRLLARSLHVLIDCLVLSIAYWLAFLFRFEFVLPGSQLSIIALHWPYVVFVHYAGLHLLGVPLLAWRYVTMRDAARVTFAVAASSAVLVLGRMTLPVVTTAPLLNIPLGVIAMDCVLGFVGLIGVRAIWKFRGELVRRRRRQAGG